MVREYKRKKEKTWSEEDMKKAMEHTHKHNNIAAASRLFGVPKTTLKDRLSGRVGPEHKVGHPTALSAKEEAEIIETCIIICRAGLWIWKARSGECDLRVTKKKIPSKMASQGKAGGEVL